MNAHQRRIVKRQGPSEAACKIMIGEFYTWLKASFAFGESRWVDIHTGLFYYDYELFTKWIKDKPNFYVDTLSVYGPKFSSHHHAGAFYADELNKEIERRFEANLLGKDDEQS